MSNSKHLWVYGVCNQMHTGGRPGVEVNIMTPSTDKIKATVVAKMHRNGYYDPRAVPVEGAASWGVASHNRGLAKEVIAEMANADNTPVEWKVDGQVVFLRGSAYDVALYIAAHGGSDAVPWDLKDEL